MRYLIAILFVLVACEIVPVEPVDTETGQRPPSTDEATCEAAAAVLLGCETLGDAGDEFEQFCIDYTDEGGELDLNCIISAENCQSVESCMD